MHARKSADGATKIHAYRSRHFSRARRNEIISYRRIPLTITLALNVTDRTCPSLYRKALPHDVNLTSPASTRLPARAVPFQNVSGDYPGRWNFKINGWNGLLRIILLILWGCARITRHRDFWKFRKPGLRRLRIHVIWYLKIGWNVVNFINVKWQILYFDATNFLN